MKKLSTLQLFGISLILTFLFIQCGTDSNPVSVSGVVDVEETTGYTVSFSVSPSNVYRTLDTWNAWVNPVTVEFQSTFETEHSDDDGHVDDDDDAGHVDDDGHAHKTANGGDTVHHGDIMLCDLALEGFKIIASASHASTIYHMDTHGHEGDEPGMHFVEEHGMDGDFMLMVHLQESITGHAPHGGTSIGYSNVHVKAVDADGNELEFPLKRIATTHGFRYADNVELPAGTYDLHVEAEAPAFSRLSGYDEKFTGHMEGGMNGFTFTDSADAAISSEEGSFQAEDLSLRLRVGSVAPFAAIGTGAIPLSGAETLQFSVSISDASISPEAENILYSQVIARITNNETGDTTEKVLVPVYSEHGFHYAGNVSLPEGHGMVDSTDDHDDEDEGDEHGH